MSDTGMLLYLTNYCLNLSCMIVINKRIYLLMNMDVTCIQLDQFAARFFLSSLLALSNSG
jgi:hypothetical protein